MRKRRTARLPMLAIIGLPLVTLIVGAIALGPMRALRIAIAGSTNVMIDGLAEERPPHRIPVLDLRIADDVLAALNADVPWSGNDPKPAELWRNGIRHPATVRYRGLFVGTHYLGGKKSMRLALPSNNPLSPYRRVNLINPKSSDFLNQHMAFWIASRMGVAVPWSDLVFVDLNGLPHGVHHAIEQLDGDFERNRHLVDHEVPVFKGDYPPATGRQRPEGRYLYAAPGNWEYASDADSTQAFAQLGRLIAVVNNDTLSDAERLDSLALLIDIDAFVRYHAALKVLHCTHADNVHNQWLVQSPRSGKFYPVLWDPILLFAKQVDPFYPIHDAVEFHLMRHAGLRLQRDRYIHSALEELVHDSLFDRRFETEAERIRPSVFADRNKHGEVTDHAEDVLRFSALHWARSCDALRAGTHAYWRTLEARMHIDSLTVKKDGDALVASWKGDGVLGFRALGDSATPAPIGMHADLLRLDDGGIEGTELHPSYPVAHSMGDKPRVLKDGEYWSTPKELRIALNGNDPANITFINLTTGETVEARH